MCYLVARDRKKRGCYALNTEHGEPSAYGEYEPYIMVDTEIEFEEKVKELC